MVRRRKLMYMINGKDKCHETCLCKMNREVLLAMRNFADDQDIVVGNQFVPISNFLAPFLPRLLPTRGFAEVPIS